MSDKIKMFYFKFEHKLQNIPYIELQIQTCLKNLQRQLSSMKNQDKYRIRLILNKKLKKIQDFYQRNYIDYRAYLILKSIKMLHQFLLLHDEDLAYEPNHNNHPISSSNGNGYSNANGNTSTNGVKNKQKDRGIENQKQKQKLAMQTKINKLNNSSQKQKQKQKIKKLQQSSPKSNNSTSNKLVTVSPNQVKKLKQKDKTTQAQYIKISHNYVNQSISPIRQSNKGSVSPMHVSQNRNIRKDSSNNIQLNKNSMNINSNAKLNAGNQGKIIKRQRTYTDTDILQKDASKSPIIKSRQNIAKKTPILQKQKLIQKQKDKSNKVGSSINQTSKKITKQQYIKYLKNKDKQ